MEQEQECLVQTVEVRHARDVHCATFYVEKASFTLGLATIPS